ncbi:MAG: hypothetical protein LBM60_02810, partial [Clostridium sp.]|nr:hypothetical protein [Clostridium sp.]
MPITVLTSFQLLYSLIIYAFVTCLVPSFALSKQLARFRLSTRFLFSFVLGNFYIINLVYILQLLRLSNWITLTLATALPVAVIKLHDRNKTLKIAFLEGLAFLIKLFSGQYGFRLYGMRIIHGIRNIIKRMFLWILKQIKAHPIDCILLTGLGAITVWYFGYFLVTNLGYGVSDMVVHNQWINEMEWNWPWEEGFRTRNTIFYDGVYPFGMHNTIYYLHSVFRIDVYILLRVFWMAQVVMLLLVSLASLRILCKSKCAPYIGIALYLFVPFHVSHYYRLYSSLPQEFGIPFILPSVCFFVLFLQRRKVEVSAVMDGLRTSIRADQSEEEIQQKGYRKKERKLLREAYKKTIRPWKQKLKHI